ncbi:TadE family protein [Duganella sp. P38]|uniref:TadE family protein n=1 Tax=Duganella sp. P38 TaxID=3423949 RepID=UPI003D798A1C
MRPFPSLKCRGIATIELALALPVILMVLMFLLLAGSLHYKYEVAQKAARNASRYLSSVSKLDMKNPAQIGYHTALARAMIESELSAVSSTPYPPTITIICGAAYCDGYSLPATVTVTIRILAVDTLFGGFTSNWIGGDFLLVSSATMAYAGT